MGASRGGPPLQDRTIVVTGPRVSSPKRQRFERAGRPGARPAGPGDWPPGRNGARLNDALGETRRLSTG